MASANAAGNAADERPQVVCVSVAVPAVVLGREDCDPSLEVPEPLLPDASLPAAWPHAGPALSVGGIRAPPGCVAGGLLDVPVTRGTEEGHARVRLPADVAAGELLYIVERPRGCWHAKRVTREFAHAVPEGEEEMTLTLPDGTQFSFAVPSGLHPWQIMAWKQQGETNGGWALEQVYAASTPEPTIPDAVDGPFRELLESIRARGFPAKLPLADGGVLRVSLPCCGRLGEYAALGHFLAANCLTLPGVTSVKVFATDYNETYTLNWAVAESWFGQFQPKIQFQACVRDLATEPLPPAGLVIAVHPEVTRGGVWFPIIASILRSGSGGLCAFATFYEDELRTLANMVDMYGAPAGGSVEEIRNPYYLRQGSLPAVPRARFLMHVASEAVRPEGVAADAVQRLPPASDAERAAEREAASAAAAAARDDSAGVLGCSTALAGPYRALLQLLRSSDGLLAGLLPSGAKEISVSVPFCGAFLECNLLIDWLREVFITELGVERVNVLATDIFSNASYQWPAKEAWAKTRGVNLELRESDLAKDTLPEAQLIIGLHPEVSWADFWTRIFAMLLKSASKGLCVFATYMEYEASLANKLLSEAGAKCKVVVNPFWRDDSRSCIPESTDNPMRYLLFVQNADRGPLLPELEADSRFL